LTGFSEFSAFSDFLHSVSSKLRRAMKQKRFPIFIYKSDKVNKSSSLHSNDCDFGKKIKIADHHYVHKII
jgi:hypothetical protein